MKKKLLTFLIVGLLGFSTFFLTACGGGAGGSAQDAVDKTPGFEQPEKDPDDGGEEGTSSGNFEDYFSGYRVLKNADENMEIFDEISQTKTTFNNLLDRQFSALAEDILYRLLVVYGDENKVDLPNKPLTNTINNRNYELNGNNAYVVINSLLTKETEHTNGVHTTANVNCIYCYQEVVNNPNVAVNYLNHTNVIKLTGAISGSYMSLDATGALEDTPQENKKWKSNDSNKFKYNAETNQNTYINNFKFALAKIVVGDESFNDVNYDVNEYNNILSRINNLGYFNINSDKEAENSLNKKIISYVEHSIIGLDRINESESAYDGIIESGEGNLKPWKKPEEDDVSEEDETYKRYFKGYNIVVPAVVDMALNNKFYGETGFTEELIYPYFLRVGSQEGNFETIPNNNDGDFSITEKLTTTGPINFNSLILKPKDNALLKSIQLNINVARDTLPQLAPGSIAKDVGRYKRDIVVEFEVNFSLFSSGAQFCNQILAPSHEESTVLSIDSAGWRADEVDDYIEFSYEFNFKDNFGSNPPRFGEYNGSNSPIDEMTLWNNNAFILNDNKDALSLDAGGNYVQINFVNVKVFQTVSTSAGQQKVPYTGTDVVYDLNIMPLN